MTQPYPVVGAEGTGVHPRLELRVLNEKKPIHFSLFIRALNNLQAMKSEDAASPYYVNKPNSWWQMGGIHGMPYVRWSGDSRGTHDLPAADDADQHWEGYCYHGSVLFPTWHRALVLLVEQAVVNEAIAIAKSLEEKDPIARKEEWVRAAKELRFPYWDWTTIETAEKGIPKLCQIQYIDIWEPGRLTIQVKNPLHCYNYPQTRTPTPAPEAIRYMDTWHRTYRWADQRLFPNNDDYDKAKKAFASGGEVCIYNGEKPSILESVDWLRWKVSGLFTYDLTLKDPAYAPNMWAYFSNANNVGPDGHSVFNPTSTALPSLEDSHNKVHLDTGGVGSMGVNEFASFDPIFFLHHCNVDRIYAFWEYLYPEYWFDGGWRDKNGNMIPFQTLDGTYAQDPGAVVTHATPLAPFRTKAFDYWNSDNTRSLLPEKNVTNKYYTYPAIKDPLSGEEVQVDVPYDVTNIDLRKKYQRILFNEWCPYLDMIVETHRDASKKLPQHVGIVFKEENNVVQLRQFYIVGEMQEFAFPGSHRLELYLLQKGKAPILVNDISVLARSDPNKCGACKDRRAAKSRVRGHMYLDPRIIIRLLASLDPAQLPTITDVETLSKLVHQSFGMRVVKPDGAPLAAADSFMQPADDGGPLHASKTPQLTLHSHVLSFNQVDKVAPIEFESRLSHGTFAEHLEWRELSSQI